MMTCIIAAERMISSPWKGGVTTLLLQHTAPRIYSRVEAGEGMNSASSPKRRTLYIDQKMTPVICTQNFIGSFSLS